MRSSRLGFVGLGTMGTPIALNLHRAGTPLLVWNRSAARCAPLSEAGAAVASTVDEVFASCSTVIAMVTDGPALDDVLGRGTPAFAARLRGRTLVSMGTFAVAYSEALAADVAAARGRYVEAPVSGSAGPAARAELIALLAGEPDAVEDAAKLLAPACRLVLRCGEVPSALLMKHATNIVLIPMMIALAEAGGFVRRAGLDIETFGEALLASQMACDLFRAKVPKLLAADYATAQASVHNVRLAAQASDEAVRSEAVLLAAAHRMLVEASAQGLALEDVMALAARPARS